MKLKSKILHFITSNFTCRRHQHLRRILKPNPMSVATIDIPQNTIIQFWFTGQNLNHFSNPHFEKFVFRQLNQNKHLHHIKSQNTSWVAECWESWLILIWGQLPAKCVIVLNHKPSFFCQKAPKNAPNFFSKKRHILSHLKKRLTPYAIFIPVLSYNFP